MCLTGVDYFSTLGYQPGIAFLAAGLLSPLATLVLVLLTLFGALPIYRRVAEASPHGQGSIAMLEELLPRWKGKAFVLCLLGFAATDFVITITLSAADATAHILENPFVPACVQASGRRDARPARRARRGLPEGLQGGDRPRGRPRRRLPRAQRRRRSATAARTCSAASRASCRAWRDALFTQHGSPLMMVALALLLFPKLALGLSGFETGVAVMPLVKGDPDDSRRASGRPHPQHARSCCARPRSS